MPATESDLQVLIRRIVEAVDPLRIILFGSAARDQTKPDSDIDLLVVMPEGTHRRHTAAYLYRTIHGVRTPFDLVVATVGDLERHRENVGLIYHTVLCEGRTLYNAA